MHAGSLGRTFDATAFSAKHFATVTITIDNFFE